MGRKLGAALPFKGRRACNCRSQPASPGRHCSPHMRLPAHAATWPEPPSHSSKHSPPPESQWCRVATIAEALQLARPAIAAGQLRGVMVETKQPTYHDRHGLPLEQKLVNELVNASYGTLPSGSVILESFELQVRLVRDWCSFDSMYSAC